MKKNTKISALALSTVVALGLPLVVSAKTMSATDIQDLTKNASGITRTAYVFGKHVYVGSITTAQLVEAAGTLDGETSPVLYYVNSTGSWTNAVTNDTVDATKVDFNIVKAANLATAVVDSEAKEADTEKVDATTLSFEDDATADLKIDNVRLIDVPSSLGDGLVVKTNTLSYNTSSLNVSKNGSSITLTETEPLYSYSTDGEVIGLLFKTNHSFDAAKVTVKINNGANLLDAAAVKNAKTYGGLTNEFVVLLDATSLEESNVLTISETADDNTTSLETYTIIYNQVKDYTSYTSTTNATVNVTTSGVKVAQVTLDKNSYAYIFYSDAVKPTADADLKKIEFTENSNLKSVTYNTNTKTWGAPKEELVFKNIEVATVEEAKVSTDAAKWNQAAVTVAYEKSAETDADYVVTVTKNKELHNDSSNVFLKMDLGVTASKVTPKDVVITNTTSFTYALNASVEKKIETFTYTDAGDNQTVKVKFIVINATPQLAVTGVNKANSIELYAGTKVPAEGSVNTAYQANMAAINDIATPAYTKDITDKAEKTVVDEVKAAGFTTANDTYYVTIQANNDLNSFVRPGVTGSKNWIALVIDMGIDVSKLTSTNTNVVLKDTDADTSFSNLGGNSTSIVVWVDADTTNNVTLTNTDTKDTVNLVIKVNKIGVFVPSTIKVNGVDTYLTDPVVTDDYAADVQYVTIGNKNYFAVNSNVYSFNVTAAGNKYTFYCNQTTKNASNCVAENWASTNSLKLVSATKDYLLSTYSTDEKYNVNSIQSVTVDGNTINVVFNRTLSSYLANGQTKQHYALVLDLGVKNNTLTTTGGYEIENIDRADVLRHVASFYKDDVLDTTNEDYYADATGKTNYLIVWITANLTDREDGYTINFVKDGEKVSFPVTIKSTYAYNAKDLKLNSAAAATTSAFDTNATVTDTKSNSYTYTNASNYTTGLSAETTNGKVVVSHNRLLAKYAGKMAILVDLGIDPTKVGLATTNQEVDEDIEAANKTTTARIITDSEAVSRLGGTSATEFVLLLDTNQFAEVTPADGSDKYYAQAITFTNSLEDNKNNVFELEFVKVDTSKKLEISSVEIASASIVTKDNSNDKLYENKAIFALNQNATTVETTKSTVAAGANTADSTVKYTITYATGAVSNYSKVGSEGADEWVALIVDLGIDSSKIAMTATNSNAVMGLVSNKTDLGLSGTQFVVWVKGNDTITFTNTDTGIETNPITVTKAS